MHVYKFSFLNTSNTYRVVNNYFRPCGRLEGRLLYEARSEVFERKADYFMLTTSFEKKYSFIAPRIEKNTRNIVKITLSCGNYNVFTFFSSCLPQSRTTDHRARSPFLEFQAIYLSLELAASRLS